MERILLRPHEAAIALGVSRSKIYELIASRAIPSVRLGAGSVRIPMAELHAWVASEVQAQAGGAETARA